MIVFNTVKPKKSQNTGCKIISQLTEQTFLLLLEYYQSFSNMLILSGFLEIILANTEQNNLDIPPTIHMFDIQSDIYIIEWDLSVSYSTSNRVNKLHTPLSYPYISCCDKLATQHVALLMIKLYKMMMWHSNDNVSQDRIKQ